MKEEKKWLVKSSDSILGPYIFDDVVTHIFNGEIHLLDEIKGPFERWRPIKDHSLFAAAIEKLKASTYQNRENTVTATVDINTKTQEMTKSQTVSLTNKDNSSITPTSETVIYQPESIPVDPHSAPLPNQPPPPQAQSGNRFPTAFLVSFLLIVFGGASYLVYEFKQTRLIEQKISLYDQLTDVAIDSLKVGEYQKALNNFKRAYNISPQDPNLVAEMAPLSVQFDGQFDQTQALLENLMATTNEKSIIKIAHNAIGLSHSYRENFEKALESYDVSLDIDPNYLPSLLNKAFAFLKLEQHLEAVGLMRKVVSDYPDEPIAHYLYIRSLAELGMAKKDEKALKEALSVSDQFSRKFSDFKQEVLFLIAVVNSYLEVKPAQPEQLVDQFLRVDPELTRLHVHDPNVDFQSFNWFDFISHCERLEQGLSDYKAQVLQAFCALKVNNPIDAKRKLEQWLSEGSNDGLLQSLYSSALLALGNVSQAKNALGYINEVDPKQPVVETILRGCLRAGDLSCGEAIFRGQHAQHISLLYSHWGNSEVNFAKDRGKAKSSVVLGLSISPHFFSLTQNSKENDKMISLRPVWTTSLIVACVSLFFLFPALSQEQEDPVVSQQEQGDEESTRWKTIQMPFNYQNMQVPRELWQYVKDSLRDKGATASALEDFAVLPVSINVELAAEESVILKDSSNYQLRFIEGGGDLDLFDYVTGKGTFFIRMIPELDGEKPFHLLYMSDSPGKEIEGDTWGNGCGQIYDLTDSVDRFTLDDGMRVTGSRRHYMHLMAGTFFFFQLVDEKLFLSYIRFKDSRYPSFSCSKT